ncbi:MAG: NTPase [Chryseobacterium sp.]|nr:MAG: NTPase [Chryseobacterium sp.]
MWADNETSEDLLGFKVHADLLIDVINDNTVLPVTIGVFGDWGSGKSSVLQIIKSEFDKEENKDTLCIYFNGWTFEGYDDAKAALLKAILTELQDNKKLSAEVKEAVLTKAKKLWKSIDWMRGAGMIMKNIALPAVTAYFTGGLSLIPFGIQKLAEFGVDSPEKMVQKLQSKDGAEFFKSLQKPAEASEDKTNAVADFRSDFEDLLKATNFKKLVVIIDDLDRCTPDRIIDNLEAVKLFLNVANTAFVIGADPRIVKHAIEHRYTQKGKISESDNSDIVKDYLEKLIQIPYNLPKLSDSEVETYISLLICKRELPADEFETIHKFFLDFRKRDRYSVCGFSAIKESIAAEKQESILKSLVSIPNLVPIITQTLSGNPRQIKRFLNTLTLRERLAKVANIEDFNLAILAKLMVLEYSNTEITLFKQLYDWQVEQKGIPEQIKALEKIAKGENEYGKAKTAIEKFDELKSWSGSRLLNWLKVEPSLSNIDLSDYFWLSRDKIASTISGTSLIPTVVKSLYKKLEADSMPALLTTRIIKEEVLTLSDLEKNSFIDFAGQMLIQNPKKKRIYDLFHAMLDLEIANVSERYAKSLEMIAIADIPVAVGESIKRYAALPKLKAVLTSKFKTSKSPVAEAYNRK